MPQTAYHGSPHEFDAFRMDRVGSGEGAQDFGWGLYFTALREIAGWYTGDLGVSGATVPALYLLNGQRTEPGTPEQKAADLIFSAGLPHARKLATEMLLDAQGDMEWTRPRGREYYEGIHTAVMGVARRSQVKKAPGLIYEVQIPDNEFLLSWGKAGAEQPARVQDALRSIGCFDPGATGEQIYHRLSRDCGSPMRASQGLHAIGVRGIRYLIGNARDYGAREDFNFVIFSDRDVHLIARNLLPRASSRAPPDAIPDSPQQRYQSNTSRALLRL